MERTQKQIETNSAAETQALAAELAAELPPGTVLCLHGDLGAGKTCFVQGLARALGVRRPVGSPTFTLINEYKGTKPLAHVDLYRIRGAGDAFGLGLEDYLCHYPGIVAIDWAERVAELLPENCWHVRLEAGATEDARRITVDRPAPGGSSFAGQASRPISSGDEFLHRT
jgi:tRNA threonylcarbamoyladenosine biosynthesis protein TsaE